MHGWVLPRVAAHLQWLRFPVVRMGHNRSRAYKGSAGLAFNCHSFFTSRDLSQMPLPRRNSNFQSLLLPIHLLVAWQAREHSEVSLLTVNSNEEFPWFPVIAYDPRNKDSKIMQNATSLHAAGKFNHVCKFLGPQEFHRFITGFIKENWLFYLSPRDQLSLTHKWKLR